MFLDYIISNFALLCISIAMFFILIYNVRGQKRENLYSGLIIASALLLSVIIYMEKYFSIHNPNIFGATFFCFLGYVIRPVVMYFFIQLVGKKVKYPWIFYIPLGFNLLVYASALFINVDWLKHLAFYYEFNEAGTALVHHRGYLNFTAHTIGAILVLYFLVNVFIGLNGKHKTESIVLFVCSFFGVVAVILEATLIAENLLNVTIAIACFFYYLYIYTQQSRRDALTGCFDRKSFYHDSVKFGKNINGVLNIDMNGLKAINDNHGHHEGDIAIAHIAMVIEDHAKKNAYVYRMGGDEFTVLLVNGSEAELIRMSEDIKETLRRGNRYSVSIGYAYNEDKDLTLEELTKIADEKMYLDKEKYYRDGTRERRHSVRT